MKEIFYSFCAVVACWVISHLFQKIEKCKKGGRHQWQNLPLDLQTQVEGESDIIRQECQKCGERRDVYPFFKF